MSWKPLPPMPRSASSLGKLAVTLAGTLGSGRSRARMMLVVRPAALVGPVVGTPWLRPGARITILLGEGAHAGLLRVERAAEDGPYGWHVPGGKHQRIALGVFLPWPEGVAPAKHLATPMEYELGVSHLQVTLPGWAKPRAPGGVAGAAVAAEAARARAGMAALGRAQ